MMKTRQMAALVLCLVVTTLFSAAPALAADGTLKVSFKDKDLVTGVERGLNSGFIYLRNAASPAPMEKFFSKADYILGPSNYLDGRYAVSVPAGTYYIRILQRKVISGALRPYGPPEAGDLTWFQTTPITITADAVLDLGTKYALPFSSAPITVTGTVRSSAGTPLEGRYVRAQTEPCVVPLNCTDTGCEQYGNQCGPNKFLAQRATDSEGRYTLYLAEPGTYYLYTSPCLVAGHNQNDDSRCRYTAAPAPVTVTTGGSITVDFAVD
jgi:hypothetical protein